MSTYESLSIHVNKEQLNQIIKSVVELGYLIYWGFDKGKMILHIYNEDMNHKLTFIRHKGYLELIKAEIKENKIIALLDSMIPFSKKVNENKRKQTDFYYKEIDWYLSELHRFIRNGEEQKIKETKEILRKLVEKL